MSGGWQQEMHVQSLNKEHGREKGQRQRHLIQYNRYTFFPVKSIVFPDAPGKPFRKKKSSATNQIFQAFQRKNESRVQ